MRRIPCLLLVGVVCLSAPKLMLASENSTACASSNGARQLDYWLGDWSVASPGMSGRGHSTVHLSLDKCMLVESWGSDTSDHRGENTMAYNPDDKSWYGLFVDNQGRVHALKGSVTPGSAELQGPALDGEGKAVLKKVRIVSAGADKVEQIWEVSSDNGASWKTDFKMEYVRKNP